MRYLDYDDVRRGDECGGGEDDGEGSEGQEAEAVQNHGGKLPLRLQLGSGGVCSDLVSDDRDLHPDALELLLQARGFLLLLLLRGEQGPELGTGGIQDRLTGRLSGGTISTETLYSRLTV